MIFLAMKKDEHSVLQKEIAEAEDISFKYLDQIISELKAAGLIETAGGKKSGYRLTMKPSEITVYDIYKAFNSELKILDCLDNAICEKINKCAAQEFWQNLNSSIMQIMKSTTIAELAEKQEQINQEKQQIMFYI